MHDKHPNVHVKGLGPAPSPLTLPPEAPPWFPARKTWFGGRRGVRENVGRSKGQGRGPCVVDAVLAQVPVRAREALKPQFLWHHA